MDSLLLIPPWVWIALGAFGAIMGTVAYLILLERKIASWAQDRIGPNRVGPAGLLQPMADGLKFLLKEDYRPGNVDWRLFSIAPALMMTVMIVSIAVLPWGGTMQTQRTITVSAFTPEAFRAGAEAVTPWWATLQGIVPVDGSPNTFLVTYRWPFQIATLNIGVLFIIAVLSLAVYGVVLGGWASNNKYSFLGGLRATANMISYEVPLGLLVLTVVVLFGTLELNQLVTLQAHYWWAFGMIPIPSWNALCHPLAFVLFLTAIHAEANRAPFDIAEAEQELVGGYHTEYSSMRFALFFLSEYAGMITTSVLCVALFFGGWHIPWVDLIWPGVFGDTTADPSITSSLWVCLVRAGALFAKTMLVIGVFMWVRWSLPRFRFDQIMDLAWRAMIPICLALLLATGLTVWAFGADRDASLHVGGKMALTLVSVNVLVLVATMLISRLLPAGPNVNRRIRVVGSRFSRTPTPAAVS
jgi:NADH-quinone oxidoreductase subunit H